MRFTEPAGDAVVADGSHFWIYYASVNPGQVLKVPLDPALGGLDFYREFLESPETKYDAVLEGREEVTGHATHRLRLVPVERRGYSRARVWIDAESAMIRRVEVHEDNGTVREVELDAIRVDPPLAADAFTFRVPDGVRVISR
jgi:outer membrane lipoprotein-sorting protein